MDIGIHSIVVEWIMQVFYLGTILVNILLIGFQQISHIEWQKLDAGAFAVQLKLKEVYYVEKNKWFCFKTAFPLAARSLKFECNCQ